MFRYLGPYIVLKRISLTIWDYQQIPSTYCGLHQIPRNPRKFKADRLYHLYSVITTQQIVDADNKRFDGFGDPPYTHPLSEVLVGVSNILNFEKSWQDFPITNQTHSFSNGTDIYQLLPSTPLTTCSSPSRAVRSHSLVCSENSLLIVGIGLILNKELELIFRSDRSDRTCVYS